MYRFDYFPPKLRDDVLVALKLLAEIVMTDFTVVIAYRLTSISREAAAAHFFRYLRDRQVGSWSAVVADGGLEVIMALDTGLPAVEHREVEGTPFEVSVTVGVTAETAEVACRRVFDDLRAPRLSGWNFEVKDDAGCATVMLPADAEATVEDGPQGDWVRTFEAIKSENADLVRELVAEVADRADDLDEFFADARDELSGYLGSLGANEYADEDAQDEAISTAESWVEDALSNAGLETQIVICIWSSSALHAAAEIRAELAS